MRYFTQPTRVSSVAVSLDCFSPVLLLNKLLCVTITLLSFTVNSFSQTITDAQPRRVTTGTVVTVTGTDFSPGIVDRTTKGRRARLHDGVKPKPEVNDDRAGAGGAKETPGADPAPAEAWPKDKRAGAAAAAAAAPPKAPGTWAAARARREGTPRTRRATNPEQKKGRAHGRAASSEQLHRVWAQNWHDKRQAALFKMVQLAGVQSWLPPSLLHLVWL